MKVELFLHCQFLRNQLQLLSIISLLAQALMVLNAIAHQLELLMSAVSVLNATNEEDAEKGCDSDGEIHPFLTRMQKMMQMKNLFMPTKI